MTDKTDKNENVESVENDDNPMLVGLDNDGRILLEKFSIKATALKQSENETAIDINICWAKDRENLYKNLTDEECRALVIYNLYTAFSKFMKGHQKMITKRENMLDVLMGLISDNNLNTYCKHSRDRKSLDRLVQLYRQNNPIADDCTDQVKH